MSAKTEKKTTAQCKLAMHCKLALFKWATYGKKLNHNHHIQLALTYALFRRINSNNLSVLISKVSLYNICTYR